MCKNVFFFTGVHDTHTGVYSVVGGFIGMLMSEAYWKDKLPSFILNLENRMKDMEEAGVWRIVERGSVPDYYTLHGENQQGALFVLQLNNNKNEALHNLSKSLNPPGTISLSH